VDSEQAAPRGSGRRPIVLGVLVAAAALLSFLAIRRNLYEGYGSVLGDSFLADVGAWAPTVALVVGLVLLWRRTGVGAEWIIGAGASFVLLNYGGLVDFLRREDTSLDTTAMVMRTIAESGRRHFARQCLDWSERRPHISGALGAAIAQTFFTRGWAERLRRSRTVRLTDSGRRAMGSHFGATV
jgi:hypothetical protein